MKYFLLSQFAILSQLGYDPERGQEQQRRHRLQRVHRHDVEERRSRRGGHPSRLPGKKVRPF